MINNRLLWLSLTFATGSAAGSALAVDLPSLKPGLWESRTMRQGDTGAAGDRKTVMCVDAQFQKDMMQMGMGVVKSMCTRNDLRVDGAKMYGSSECKLGASTIQSTSVTTFKGDSSYHTEVKATYTPPFMGQSESSTVLDARLIGPCKPGMQPGDIIMPDGRTMNMRTILGGAK